MRCPTPCEECGAIVELSDMRKLRGGLGGFVCAACYSQEPDAEDEDSDEESR